jgi:hypothetical protein
VGQALSVLFPQLAVVVARLQVVDLMLARLVGRVLVGDTPKRLELEIKAVIAQAKVIMAAAVERVLLYGLLVVVVLLP